MDKLFANIEKPDQTPRSAASDLGLHCLPITLLWISRQQLVKLDLKDLCERNCVYQHSLSGYSLSVHRIAVQQFLSST